MLSLLETYNQCQQHKQQIAQQVVAQMPGFDQKNPQHQQALNQTLAQHTYEIGLYTLGGESLLGRARNHMAAVALKGGFDKLFFIDADTGWTWDQFKDIAGSPHPVIGGVVPLKTYFDYPQSFRTSLNFLPFQDDEKYFDRAIRDLAGTVRMAEGRGSPIVPVAFTGTGYLCISTSVFVKLAETAEPYLYPDPYKGEVTTHFSFFDGGPMAEQYLSEDWAFIGKCREAGYDAMINVNVRLSHTGNNTYRAG